MAQRGDAVRSVSQNADRRVIIEPHVKSPSVRGTFEAAALNALAS
jgi:hypothetical protein